MTIRTRLTFRFTLLVTAIMAVAFAFVHWFCWYFLTSDFNRRLDRKAYTIADLLLHREVDAQFLSELSRIRRDQLPDQKVTVYDQTNTAIFTTNDTIHFQVTTSLLDRIRKADASYSFRENTYSGVGITYSTVTGDYVVIATARNTFGDEFLKDMRQMLALLFLAITALVCLSGWLFTGDALRPMQRIEHHLNRIFPRTLSERLVADSTDEPGRLSATINRLLDRIEESFVMQRMFVANVSHELKNPLTQISSQLEVLLLRQRQPQEYERVIRSVVEDVGQMTQLTHELLQLSRVNTDNAVSLLTEEVRLDEILWDVQKHVRSINSQYAVDLQLQMPEDFEWLTIHGSSTLLRTAFKNLIENACKFAEDGKATVMAQFEPDKVVIGVSNQGKPIPLEELPYIFQPFYRSKPTAEVRGYGIGLSLVDHIVRLHSGRIEVSSLSGEPTIFRLTLFR